MRNSFCKVCLDVVLTDSVSVYVSVKKGEFNLMWCTLLRRGGRFGSLLVIFYFIHVEKICGLFVLSFGMRL